MSDSEIEDGGTAFPCKMEILVEKDKNFQKHEVFYQGMTLRDWFAGQALFGRLANPFIQENQMQAYGNALIKSGGDSALLGVRWEAEWAYRIADAMIAERSKK